MSNIFAPNKPRCRCECGYRCGGPGTCKLDLFECLKMQDGNHFVRDCDHNFADGPMVEWDTGASESCARCGMLAITHDMAVGP